MAISFTQEKVQKKSGLKIPFWIVCLFVYISFLGFIAYSILTSVPKYEDVTIKGTTEEDLEIIGSELEKIKDSPLRFLKPISPKAGQHPTKIKTGRKNPFVEK